MNAAPAMIKKGMQTMARGAANGNNIGRAGGRAGMVVGIENNKIYKETQDMIMKENKEKLLSNRKNAPPLATDDFKLSFEHYFMGQWNKT